MVRALSQFVRGAAIPRRRAIVSGVALGCICFANGCTLEDAIAASTQLTATASALTNYYSALDTILVETGQLNALQEVMYGIPYDARTKGLIADTKAEIEKREALAKDLANLAQSFAKLTGSTSPADASASASNLQTEVASLKLAKIKMSDDEQNGMNTAVMLVVAAIQEHKEREAARGIGQFTGALHDFFVKEEPAYESINKDYVAVSSSLAKSMLQNGQTDPSGSFKIALDPYGLTPQVSDPKLRSGIEKLAEQEVDEKANSLNDAEIRAGADMDKCLKEMADRIGLVADEKPMKFRLAPITVANVEKWSSQFQTMASSAATAKAPAATTPSSKSPANSN